jgi:acetyl esterase/lipase
METLTPWLFLAASLLGALLTCNAYRPVYYPSQVAVLSFFAGWLIGELPFHTIVWQAIATVFFTGAGALESWPGILGLAVTALSWLGLCGLHARSLRAETAVDEALERGLSPAYRRAIVPEAWPSVGPAADWKRLAVALPTVPPEVDKLNDIPYAIADGVTLKLDVYTHRARPRNRPMLLQIHGGAWVVGSKNEQGRPLMTHMAAQGWVCVSADYRLSPRATFPDHLVDLKRALCWMREHAAEYGGDPNFIVVTGGSAGGHLCSLMALTANDPEYQPGFESADTSVQGCVPFYGVYDFTNSDELREHLGLVRFVSKKVLKLEIAERRDAFERASPFHCRPEAPPPFFVVHGSRDSLVSVRTARSFVEALRKISRNPVVYAEIPGAQHAFEIFWSVRTAHVVRGVESFLDWVYSRHLTARSARGQMAEKSQTVESQTASAV